MTPTPNRGGETSSDWSRMGWWGAAILALWLPVWWRLKDVWMVDPEMRHGWLVPPLVAYYAWERRKFAPIAQDGRQPIGIGLLVIALLLGAGGLLVWEANPMWPLLMGVVTGVMGVATLALIRVTEGGARMRFWAGTVVLLGLALPWPTMVQQPLTMHLATMNAHVAAEVVSAMGHPAAVHGRVIEVAEGFAGVEEACSGIRSLQTVTMVAVFLAAFFRLGWRRGTALILAGWAVAIIGNLVRTCYLILVLAQEGTEQMNALHDAAGNVVLGATLAIMSLIAWSLPEGALPQKSTAKPSGAHPLRWGALAGLVGVVATIEGSILTWYAGGERQTARVGWTWAEREDWTAAVITESAREMLGYTSGQGRYWARDEDLPSVLAFLFHWDGDMSQLGGAALHDPLVCLPSIGSTLAGHLPGLRREIPDGEIELQTFKFRTANGRTQYVFFQVWDAFNARVWDSGDDANWNRWQRVMDRRRGADTYQIVMVFEGEMSETRALELGEKAFRSIMMPVGAEGDQVVENGT